MIQYQYDSHRLFASMRLRRPRGRFSWKYPYPPLPLDSTRCARRLDSCQLQDGSYRSIVSLWAQSVMRTVAVDGWARRMLARRYHCRSMWSSGSAVRLALAQGEVLAEDHHLQYVVSARESPPSQNCWVSSSPAVNYPQSKYGGR